ncbi:pre-mRNA-splicing factor CWC22 homolog isoform X2 [Melanotaenia boesemani]|uniref:pre-mRNA-splicing factor CWC22 homolog isoform X2 n=1 Tax=Melanotaenia boesemani TaxID=1250792 RepID=UPI001C058A11|nr:pre-mRNA-splicing factor CWC22 homolog isoform X2 [Melanotaenia boesemani]
MDSPGRNRSPSPVPREQSGSSEDESSPLAGRPEQANAAERSPTEQTSPKGKSAPSSPASSSSDSSSDDEDKQALRKIRSSVAQIKRSRSREQDRSRSREEDRSSSRERNRSRSRENNRSRSKEKDRSQSRGRHRSTSTGRERSRSRSRGRDRSRSRGRDRSRSRGRDRSRSRGRDRSRSRGRERSRSRERDRNTDHFDRRRYARNRYDDRRDDRDGRFDRRANQDAVSDHRRRGRSTSPPTDKEPVAADEPPVKKKKEELDPILTRTGGAYIPPARLRMMQQQITDKSSLAYQRMSWEALKKSINGLINKVNVSNIVNIIQELLQENIVRGRGLLARSVLQAQAASPIFTHVYAAVVAIINSKFPQIGELILKRLILAFRRSYRRNLKQQCLTASKFVAHLINQNVAHEVLCLEMLTLLLERPTDDSVEVAISFLKECGLKLTEVSPRGINAIFERLRNVLHESSIDKRVQYMIEVMFAIRKDGFKDHPVIPEGLDLVDEDDQFTHMLPLEDEYNTEDVLNVFKMDPNFLENEEKYKTIKRDILDEGSSDSGEEGDGSDEDEDDEEENEEEGEDEKVTIFDQTEVNLVAFRRTIYLAIQSSLDFEECAHKLIKMDFPESQTKELCNMILDCCAQQRTYEKFFGLLAGRFCLLKKEYMESFEAIFSEQYDTIHRLETNKLRNVARLFAHLLYTDSVPWSVLECIRMSEETTTSSSRIFVKILFQELCAYMGLPKLNQRLKDQTLQPFFEGLFPRDNPRNTRFAINFFTSIGLGGLTDELREHLKNAPKMIMTQTQEVESSDSSSSSSSSSSSDSSSSDSSSESDSDSSSSSSSDSDNKHRKKKRKGQSEEKKKKEKDKKRKGKPDKRQGGHKNDKDEDDGEKQIRKDKRGRAHDFDEHVREDTRRGRRDERSDKEERREEEERKRKTGRQRDGETNREPARERENEETRDRGGERARERDNEEKWERERERARERDNEEKRERERGRERDNEEKRERGRERDNEEKRERGRERDNEEKRERGRERDNEEKRERGRERDDEEKRERERERGRERDDEEKRERERERARERDNEERRERERERARERDNEEKRERERERERDGERNKENRDRNREERRRR